MITRAGRSPAANVSRIGVTVFLPITGLAVSQGSDATRFAVYDRKRRFVGVISRADLEMDLRRAAQRAAGASA